MSDRFNDVPAVTMHSVFGSIAGPVCLVEVDPVRWAREDVADAREDVSRARLALVDAENALAEAHRRLAHAMVASR